MYFYFCFLVVDVVVFIFCNIIEVAFLVLKHLTTHFFVN